MTSEIGMVIVTLLSLIPLLIVGYMIGLFKPFFEFLDRVFPPDPKNPAAGFFDEVRRQARLKIVEPIEPIDWDKAFKKMYTPRPLRKD